MRSEQGIAPVRSTRFAGSFAAYVYRLLPPCTPDGSARNQRAVRGWIVARSESALFASRDPLVHRQSQLAAVVRWYSARPAHLPRTRASARPIPIRRQWLLLRCRGDHAGDTHYPHTSPPRPPRSRYLAQLPTPGKEGAVFWSRSLNMMPWVHEPLIGAN